MDVMATCAVEARCDTDHNGTDDEDGLGATIWEQAVAPWYIPGSAHTDPGKVTSLLVRVYLKPGQSPACDPYQVRVTNP